MDSFSDELTVMANTIVEWEGLKKTTRQDNAEVKRVELHLHTKSSAQDGIGDVKQYIATIINFYKSYKVDFLGINTIYILDDKLDGYIRLIDEMILNRYFQKNEFMRLYETIAKYRVDMTLSERVHLLERVYLDIRTWAEKHYEEYIFPKDRLGDMISRIVLYTVIQFNEEIKDVNIRMSINEAIACSDIIQSEVSFTRNDNIELYDNLWLFPFIDQYVDYSVDLHFSNVLIENGEHTIYDNRITSSHSADFIPDLSIADEVTEIRCSCKDGSVTIKLTAPGPVAGKLIVNN